MLLGRNVERPRRGGGRRAGRDDYPANRQHEARIAENDEPLLINTPRSWDDRPTTITAIPNVMTGKRAAEAVIDAAGVAVAPVSVFERWVPPENEPLKRLDEERWRLGLPHMLDTPDDGSHSRLRTHHQV